MKFDLPNIRLIRSFSWLLAAQVMGRFSRLATTLVVARLLTPEHFGLVAIALATNELASVIARFGSTAAIVQCQDDVLADRCKTAWGLNWVIGLGLFVIQCAVAYPIAIWYDSPQLALPICVLGLSYLLLPIAQVNASLTLRRSDMRSVAKTEVQQAVVDMALSVALALSGFGFWALILPKVLVIPIWIRAHRMASPWQPEGFTLKQYRPLLSFSSGVLGVELLNVLRHNIDYLLIGAFLGVEALGLYFFAFNAGLGITRGVIAALSTALYPNLCAGEKSIEEINRRFRHGIRLTGIVVITVVALQTSLAEFYVPVIFGEKWVTYGAVPILVIICLTAIPAAFIEAGSQYMRARGLPERDLRWHLRFSIVFVLAILVGVQFGTFEVAIVILIAQVINLPLYVVFNLWPVMRGDAAYQSTQTIKELSHA